jgi:autotransporter-associated beta strand protein
MGSGTTAGSGTYGLYQLNPSASTPSPSLLSSAYKGDALAVFSTKTLTWTGKRSSSWSDPRNWKENQAPVNGDTLIFPAHARINSNNDMTGLQLNSIQVQSPGYKLAGNPLELASSLSQTIGSDSYAIATELAGPVTFIIGGKLDLSAVVCDGPTSGQLVKSGKGTLILEKNNTYTGGTTLQGGTLVIAAAGSLGTSALALEAGKLQNATSSVVTLQNPMTLQGSSALTNGPGLVLTGNVQVSAAAALTDSGALTFGSGVTISGPGTLTLQGNAPVSLLGTVSTGLVAAGLIQLGLQGTLSSQGALTIAKSAVVALGTSQTGLQGAGAINVKGGTLKAPFANAAYSGAVTLASGTIQVSAANDALGTGTLTIGGGTFQDAATQTVTLANALTIDSNATVKATKSLLVFNAGVTLSGTRTMTLVSKSQIGLLGSIGGSGKLKIIGSGVVEVNAASPLLTLGKGVKLKIV